MGKPSMRRAWAAGSDLRNPLAKFVHFMSLKLCGDEREIWGIPVLVADGSSGNKMKRIEAALFLIRERDPMRLDRLRRDLIGGIQCGMPRQGIAWFYPQSGTCHLEPEYLESGVSIEEIALSIVHEATHARLWKNGFEYEPEIRHRVELICTRRELARIMHQT